MARNKIDELVELLENYVECWKQFNRYIELARKKQFDDDDEAQFLELKSLLTQQLEIILASFESGTPPREEVHALLAGATSIRFLSELSEGSLRALENQWHKIFIAWQSVLGQLKVQQKQIPKGFFDKLFKL